jgi:acyl-coenzyme A thioesterase PaaI-like protein
MQGVPEGGILVTTDLTVHYLGPIQHGPALAVGHVLRRGRKTVVVRVDVFDGHGGPLGAACQLAFSIRGLAR